MKLDATYQKLTNGLRPILTDLVTYSVMLQNSFKSGTAGELNLIAYLQRWNQGTYPEWVFKRGFNRHLRSGFRYVLVELDVVLDAYLSIEYHSQQLCDSDLLQEVVEPLCDAIETNMMLLKVVDQFFANIPIDQSFQNLTSDVTEIYNSVSGVLPPSIELLDLSPHYVHLAALVRAVVDSRKALLNIIAALPIDDLAVQQ